MQVVLVLAASSIGLPLDLHVHVCSGAILINQFGFV